MAHIQLYQFFVVQVRGVLGSPGGPKVVHKFSKTWILVSKVVQVRGFRVRGGPGWSKSGPGDSSGMIHQSPGYMGSKKSMNSQWSKIGPGPGSENLKGIHQIKEKMTNQTRIAPDQDINVKNEKNWFKS